MTSRSSRRHGSVCDLTDQIDPGGEVPFHLVLLDDDLSVDNLVLPPGTLCSRIRYQSTITIECSQPVRLVRREELEVLGDLSGKPDPERLKEATGPKALEHVLDSLICQDHPLVFVAKTCTPEVARLVEATTAFTCGSPFSILALLHGEASKRKIGNLTPLTTLGSPAETLSAIYFGEQAYGLASPMRDFAGDLPTLSRLLRLVNGVGTRQGLLAVSGFETGYLTIQRRVPRTEGMQDMLGELLRDCLQPVLALGRSVGHKISISSGNAGFLDAAREYFLAHASVLTPFDVDLLIEPSDESDAMTVAAWHSLFDAVS